VNDPQALQDYRDLVQAHGRFQIARALHAALAKRVEFELADASQVVDASVQRFDAQFPACAGLPEPLALLWRAPERQVLQNAARALGSASQPSFSAGLSWNALSEGHGAGVMAALLRRMAARASLTTNWRASPPCDRPRNWPCWRRRRRPSTKPGCTSSAWPG
jgi:ATP-dependent helicase/nuclease subunit A